MLDNQKNITYFAETDFRGKRQKFGIKDHDRTKHIYVIGKTGMGKSTMLENMVIQDIKRGKGVGFLDPHGQSAEKLLDYVPEERIKDVIYFAPFDTGYPISFNVLEDVGPDKRHLVVSGLMSSFKKQWIDAWSARMEYMLTNTLFALLEYPDSTLLGVNRMYTDKDYRKAVVAKISDPTIRSFWVDEFAKYTDRFAAEATPAIQNKVGQFTSNPIIRNIIGQSRSSFDFRKAMDEKKILIMNLSKGRIGEKNSELLGGMLITKIYLSAMSRADIPATMREQQPYFYFYVDEFQSFANESFADILSEARKYNLSLTIAHQYVAQMAEEVKDAVFGNVGTTISFRVGPLDAELMQKLFAPTFSQEDLVSLGFAQIYLSLMVNGIGSKPFSAVTLPPAEHPLRSFRDKIIEYSRLQYATPVAVVDSKIKEWFKKDFSEEVSESPYVKREERREEVGRRPRPPRSALTRGRPPRRPPRFGEAGPPRAQPARPRPAPPFRKPSRPSRPVRVDRPRKAPPRGEPSPKLRELLEKLEKPSASASAPARKEATADKEETISLSKLKQKPVAKKKDEKEVTEESRAGLREVLKKAGVSTKTEDSPSSKEEEKGDKEEKAKSKEVSEDTLRKILE